MELPGNYLGLGYAGTPFEHGDPSSSGMPPASIIPAGHSTNYYQNDNTTHFVPSSLPPPPISADIPAPPTTASPYLSAFQSSVKTDVGPTLSSTSIINNHDNHESSANTMSSFSQSPTTDSDSMDIHRVAQLGRERALGIVQQIKGQTEAAEIGRNRAKLILDQFQNQAAAAAATTGVAVVETDPTEWSRKRKVFLEQFQDKKHKALFKNLEYIARLEDERLKERFQQMQQAKEYQTQLEEYHAQHLEHRTQNKNNNNKKNNNNMAMTNSQAGIGTERRQKVEKKRKQQTTNDSLAIYVSNLPVKDGDDLDEEFMRALFGSYGSIRKIHFYLNKQTGEKKGDALVIYQVNAADGDDMEEKSKLVNTVCTQMNGATLSCGTVIHVEPSDPLYQLRKQKKQQTEMNYYGGGGGTATTTTTATEATARTISDEPETNPVDTTKRQLPAETKSGGDDDEDLDDFFASL